MSYYTCEECGKKYDSSERFARHTEKCKGLRRSASSTRSTKSNYDSHLDKLTQHYERKIQGYTNDISMLRGQNEGLQSRISEQGMDLDVKMKRMKKYYENDMATLENENNIAKNRLRDISTQNTFDDSLKQQYAREIAEKNVKLAKINQDMEKIKSECEIRVHNTTVSFDKQITDLQISHTQEIEHQKSASTIHIERLTKQISVQESSFNNRLAKQKSAMMEAYTNKINEYISKLETNSSKHASELKSLRSSCEQETDELKKKCRMVMHDFEFTKNKLVNITKELDETRANNEMNMKSVHLNKDNIINSQRKQIQIVSSELQDLKNVSTKHLNTINELQIERNQLQQRYDIDVSRYESRVTRMVADVDVAKNKYTEQASKLRKLTEEDIESRTEKINKFEGKMLEYTNLQQQHADLTHKQTELRSQYSKLSDQSRDRAKTIKEYYQLNSDLTEEKLTLSNSVKSLNARLSTSSRQVSSSRKEKEDLIEKVKTYEEKEDRMSVRIESLQQRYDKILSSAQSSLADEQVLITHLREELKKQVSKLEDQEKLYTTINAQSRELIVVKGKYESVSDQLLHLQSQIKRDQEEIGVLKTERATLSDKDETSVKTIQLYESKLIGFRHQTQQLQQSCTNTEQERDMFRDKHANILDEHTTMVKLVNYQKSKLEHYEGEITRIMGELHNMTTHYGQLKSVNNKIATTLQEMKDKLEEYTKKIIELERHNKDIRISSEKIKKSYETSQYENNETEEMYVARIKTINRRLGEWEAKSQYYQQLEVDIVDVRALLKKQRVISSELSLRLDDKTSNLKTNDTQSMGTIKLLEQKIKEIEEVSQKRLDSLETVKSQYIHTLNNLNGQLQTSLVEIEKYKETNRSLVGETVDSRKINTKLTKNINTMTRNIRAIENKYVSTISTLNIDIDELKRKYTMSNNQIAKLNIVKEKYERQRVDDIKCHENSRVAFKQHDIKETELNKRIVQLEKDSKEIEANMIKQLEKYITLNKTLETQVAYANGQLEMIRSENGNVKQLSQKLEGSEKNLLKSNHQYQLLSNELSILKSKMNNILEKKEELEQQLTQLKQRSDESGRQIDKLNQTKINTDNGHTTTIHNLNTQIVELTERYNRASELVKQLPKRDTSIKQLTQTNEEYRKKIKMTTQSYTEKYELLYEKCKQVEQTMKQSALEQTDLVKVNTSLKRQLDQHVCDIVEKSDGKVEEMYVILRDHNDTLVSRCKELEDHKASTLKLMDTYKSSIKQLQNRIEETDRKLKLSPDQYEFRKMQERCDKYAGDNQALVKRLADQTNQLNQLTKYAHELEEMKRTLVELNHTIEDLMTKNKKINLELNNRDQIIPQLRTKMIETKNDMIPLTEKIVHLNNTVARLEKEPEKLNIKVKKMRDNDMATIHKYVEQSKMLKQELKKSGDKNQSLINTIEMMTNEIDQLTADMEHMINMKEDLKKNFVTSLNDQKFEKDAQLSDVKNTIQKREERIKELEGLLSTFIQKKLG